MALGSTQPLTVMSKSSSITGLDRHREFQEIKAPKFRENGIGLVVGCQPYAPAAFTPRKYSWYSFLLEAESTPDHIAIGGILCQ